MTVSDAAALAIKRSTGVQAEASDPSGTETADNRAAKVDQLFERYRRPLLRYLKGLLSVSDDAEDIVQETYARLLQVRSLDFVESRVRGYIFKIATNLAYDRFREQQARGAHVTLDENELSGGDLEPDRIVDFGQGLEIIKQTLMDIRPRSRQVFLLRASEQLTFQEIAERLGISARTVEREMRHAIDLCQRRLRIEKRT
jgi:RNA polymerase sigma factor (sigma-70 family)